MEEEKSMLDMPAKRKRGNPRTREVYYKKLSIWCYPKEWDRMKYLADGMGVTVSRYVADRILAYKKKVPEPIERDKSQKGKICYLAFDTREFGPIMEKAEASGQKITQYIINVILGDD